MDRRTGVAFAPVGIVGLDGQIVLEALGLFGLPEAAPAVLFACPSLPVETREFAPEVSLDLPSLASRATTLTDVTVTGSRQGDLAQASLVSSMRFIDVTASAWTINTVRMMARNTSGATFDFASDTPSVQVVQKLLPENDPVFRGRITLRTARAHHRACTSDLASQSRAGPV